MRHVIAWKAECAANSASCARVTWIANVATSNNHPMTCPVVCGSYDKRSKSAACICADAYKQQCSAGRYVACRKHIYVGMTRHFPF
jgi:hypothetical protein